MALTGTSLFVEAHPISSFWQYDPGFFNHEWNEHGVLKDLHKQYHRDHPHWDRTPKRRRQHKRFHHERLEHGHRHIHFHRILANQTGQAVWYDGDGRGGACGTKLKGMYAAHRTWPCGSLVSVRKGDDYIFVRIRDRGPFGDKHRIIDLSKKAFSRLASPGAGTMDVKIYRLEK
jgi:rare lipoprotein A (peptidoglycan hydrolase)